MRLESLPSIVRRPEAARPADIRPASWLAAFSLGRREWVRFLRQRHRIVGALATPVVFWLLIGGGMGRSVLLEVPGVAGESYIRFFFPGTLLMILLFTAIFSTISIIEDRREGFLQSVLVAPISRGAVALGKILGGTALAAGQGVLFLLLAPFVGFEFTVASFLLTVSVITVLSFALTSLGFCIAWWMSSTQGFHAIMNLFLMPMWFLSGALFPVAGAWWGLKWVMLLNPLTYGLAGLRQAMVMASPGSGGPPGLGLAVNMGISCLFAGALYLLAFYIARRPTAADLQS